MTSRAVARGRPYWVEMILAAFEPTEQGGPRVGTEESRRQFADALLQRLAATLPAGLRARDSAELYERLVDAAAAVEGALEGLRFEATRRGAGNLDLCGTPFLESMESFRGDLLLLLWRSRTAAERARGQSPTKRGPSSVMQDVIAQEIAQLYVEVLGVAPTHSANRRDGRPRRAQGPALRAGRAQTPFDRICDVVEQLLHEREPGDYARDLRLSDPVRQRAVGVVKDSAASKES